MTHSCPTRRSSDLGAYCGRIGVEPDPPPAERCIVPVAGQFERGHAAHVHWYFQQGLERKRRNLPAHRAAIPGFRAPVETRPDPFQPAALDIVANGKNAEPKPGEPRGIHDVSLGTLKDTT